MRTTAHPSVPRPSNAGHRARLLGFALMLLLRAAPAVQAVPPTPVPMTVVPWEKLSNTEVGREGALVLALQPEKWRHAETPGYILHFRRETEARKVARELDYNLEYVAKLLRRPLPPTARKAHAFVFEDQSDWDAFLTVSSVPEWSHSLAIGEDLYLNLRREPGANRFNYGLLAHEATHAVVARLYPGQRWPRWLGEGFAEYVGSAGVADRRNQSIGRHQDPLPFGNMTFSELEAITVYPTDKLEVTRLYQSSERVVRFLLDQFPQDRFPQFIDSMLDGAGFEASIWKVYGDQFKDRAAFRRRYEQTAP